MKYISVRIILSLWLFLISNQMYAQFTGGQADGHTNLRLSNTACAVVNTNPFVGGLADGNSNQGLTNVPISICSVPLPIELVSVDVECISGTVEISWITATERNNDYFTIERSKDAINFEKVGVLKGSGNSQNFMNYSFNDTNYLEGISYYRLKQTDYDGNFEYSSIVSVNCAVEKTERIKVYPNPISNELTIEIEGNNEPIRFEIINALGTVLYKGVLTNKITIQTTDFALGIYLLKFETLPNSKANGKTFEIKKIIKR
jgi:Secretion system C-terminal sorting domain